MITLGFHFSWAIELVSQMWVNLVCSHFKNQYFTHFCNWLQSPNVLGLMTFGRGDWTSPAQQAASPHSGQHLPSLSPISPCRQVQWPTGYSSKRLSAHSSGSGAVVLTHAAHWSHSKSFENPNARASAVFRALRVIPKCWGAWGGRGGKKFPEQGCFPWG